MATISSTDNLFATASIMGQHFFHFTGNGISSLSELISRVRRHPLAPKGMVTLTVRNSSQGWSQSRAFYLGA